MAEVLIADNRTPHRSGYWFCAHSFHGDIHRRHLICWHPRSSPNSAPSIRPANPSPAVGILPATTKLPLIHPINQPVPIQNP